MDRDKAFVLWFDELRRADVALVGGKSSSLGELTSQTKVPVPYGFATTAEGYRHFMHATGLDTTIKELLKGLTDVEDPVQLRDVTASIRKAICDADMPQDLADSIRTSYEELGRKMGVSDPFVAVRSSATAEDLPDASFAGQQDTYLNVKGADMVIQKVKECYASTFTDRATYYRTKQGFDHLSVALSAAVQMMEDMKDETAQILSVKKEKKKVQPPKLYDLTTLQREANRLLGFTAQQTLDYTQSLYEKKLVTYPRTDSQYLTDDMEENALLVVGAVNSMFPEMSIKGSEPDIKRLLNSKKVSDHHAIIPTVEITNMDLKALPGGEKEILMLIASRLLCASEQEYIYESIKTEISCHGELFTASGKNVLQYGWKEVEERFFKSYGKNAEKPEEEESDFPDIKIGQVFECVVVKFSEHFTAPPKHYTEDTLLSAMEHAGSSDTIEDAERKGLGTPATRAAIIEKLIEKGFIERKKKQILPTADGRNLIRILPEMIKSPKLTAEWENDLTLISRGQKNVEEFLFEIEKMVTKLVSDNGQPVEEYQKLFSDGRKEIGKCPRCGNKVYVGKRNYYCSGSDCSFTLWKNNRFFESQGKTLDEATVRKLLSEKQVHFKDLVSEKTKRKYEATIKMEVSETGNPKFQLIFPERKKGKKNEE